MTSRPVSRRGFLGQSMAAVGAGLMSGRSALAGNPTLRDLAKGAGVFIGPAVGYNQLLQDPMYGPVLAREFNILTPENDMKWGPIHPARNQYQFTRADALVSFAAQNGMLVHGHTLTWHSSNPGWLVNGTFNQVEMIEILADHIYTVAGRYRGYVLVWDVINEGINGDGSIRSTLWTERIGPEYMDLAFYFAADADPGAILIYNDHTNEHVNAKSTGIYNLVRGMLKRGVPIHGVGFQVHIPTGGLNYQSFAQNLRRFTDLGLAIFITEMEVRIQLPVTPDKLAAQAAVYRNVLDTFLDQQGRVAFQTWGFTDRYSWIPGFFPGFGAALPLDEDYVPKPAYDALAEVLAG